MQICWSWGFWGGVAVLSNFPQNRYFPLLCKTEIQTPADAPVLNDFQSQEHFEIIRIKHMALRFGIRLERKSSIVKLNRGHFIIQNEKKELSFS